MLGWLATLALVACTTSTPAPEPTELADTKPVEVPTAPAVDPAHTAMFQALPDVMAAEGVEITDAKVALGKTLYYDARLSKNHDISCNSCHQLDAFGVDGQPTSPGHKGQRGGRNSPTSYNAALHLAQFWDGRAATVEEQALGPILNPIEMAMPDEAKVLATLESIPGYKDAFAAAFPADPAITYKKVGEAIGAFERKLVTPSKFDAYLKGDAAALSAEERAGLDLFVATGCTACHGGVGVGGGMYQKLGVVQPYETADVGRFEVTKNEADKGVFKVPSLRNIAKTGPYFHDGSVATLEDAVTKMAKHQLGKELKPEEVASIVTFLGALTGTPDAALIAKPELPASGPNTPKPDAS